MIRNTSFQIASMRSKSGFMATQRLHKAMNLLSDARASVGMLCGPTLGFGEIDAGQSWQAEDLIAHEPPR
jgi:hypothetical protein